MTKSKDVFKELEELYGQFHIFGQDWVDNADVRAVTKARERAKRVIKAMKAFVEVTISEESKILIEEAHHLHDEIEEQKHEHEHEHGHYHDRNVPVDVPKTVVLDVSSETSRDFGAFTSPEVSIPYGMDDSVEI